MSYKTLALALAATGIAASLYMKTRRVAVNGPTRSDGAARADIAGEDSPNAGERLQESHAFGADAGIGEPTADGREAEDLFSSSSTSGEGPRAAGLPDFMRGA